MEATKQPFWLRSGLAGHQVQSAAHSQHDLQRPPLEKARTRTAKQVLFRPLDDVCEYQVDEALL